MPWHWQSAKVPCKENIIKRYIARSKLFHLASVTSAIFLCPARGPGNFIITLRRVVVVHSTRTLMNKDAPHTNQMQMAKSHNWWMTQTNLYRCIHFSAASILTHTRGFCWRAGSRNKNTKRAATPSQRRWQSVFSVEIYCRRLSRAAQNLIAHTVSLAHKLYNLKLELKSHKAKRTISYV